MRAFLALLAVVAFFVLVSCSDAGHGPSTVAPSESVKTSGQISATSVSNAKSDITGLVYNACTSELVSFTGTIHSKFKSKSKANGSFEISPDFSTKGRGVGLTSGDDYEVIVGSSLGVTYEVGPPFPVVRDIALERKMISHGSTDNATFILTIHTEIDANGSVTLSEFDFSTECR